MTSPYCIVGDDPDRYDFGYRSVGTPFEAPGVIYTLDECMVQKWYHHIRPNGQ